MKRRPISDSVLAVARWLTKRNFVTFDKGDALLMLRGDGQTVSMLPAPPGAVHIPENGILVAALGYLIGEADFRDYAIKEFWAAECRGDVSLTVTGSKPDWAHHD